MGFGTLFIGYFFLINISYFSYTDIVGAMIMLMGLYMLSAFDKNFKYAMIGDSVFSLFALFEIIISVIETLSESIDPERFMPYISAVRYALVFIITLFILRGISNIAKEVEATDLELSAKASIPLTAVFMIASALEMPFVSVIFGKIVPFIYFAVLLAVAVFIISNLITIYKAYMQICMPCDLERKKKKGSNFLDKFYDSIEEKSKAYTEYKLNKSKAKYESNAQKKLKAKQKNEKRK